MPEWARRFVEELKPSPKTDDETPSAERPETPPSLDAPERSAPQTLDGRRRAPTNPSERPDLRETTPAEPPSQPLEPRNGGRSKRPGFSLPLDQSFPSQLPRDWRIRRNESDETPSHETTRKPASGERPSRPPSFEGRQPNSPSRSDGPDAPNISLDRQSQERLRSLAAEAQRSRRRPPQDSSAPTTRREFANEFNRLVMEAAVRAKRETASESSRAASLAREELLNPLVGHLRELLADARSSRSPQRLRSGLRREASDWRRRLTRAVAVPDRPSTADIPSAGSSFRLLALVAALGLLALAGVVVARQMRGRWADLFGASSGPSALTSRHIASADDLVRAVDDLLVWRFGRTATWWHCRAVERAMVDLAPSRSAEISRLVAVYELARYGPRSRPIARTELDESARTVRMLVELCLAPAEQQNPAFAA